MPEITQKLGFDASQAIQTLNSLDAAMQGVRTRFSSTARAMGTFNKKANKTEGVLNRLKTSASGAATQMNRLNKAAPVAVGNVADLSAAANGLEKVAGAAQKAGDATEKAAQKSNKSTKDWTVSWKTLVRVVTTQAIVRALNAIRQTLKATVGDAIDFQKAIAEIATISDDQVGGIEGIGAVVTDVSDKFNVGLADTAEAAYQTVSNQVAKTQGELESFLGTAAKFAKITKTDMSTSVNLLSGTLNAFGKGVNEAEAVAAKFFSTIKLGRTRADELAQGMGTINPIAVKLGISMEELNASVATLTIQGLKTDKVVTQIRGAMQGFLKTTPEMEQALKQLGFATGEQILQAYNFQEAIRLVVAETDGSAAAIAKLFPRIRGLTGVMGLATDEVGHFNKSMEEQKTALEDVYDKAYTLVVSTDAEKVTKFFNEVKNFFTTQIGQRMLSGLVFVFRLDVESPKTALETLREANAEILKEANAQADKRLQIELDGIAEREQAMAQNAAVARQSFFAAADAAEEANRIIVASTEWALSSMMGPIDAASNAIQKAAADGRELMQEFSQEADKSLQTVQRTGFARSVSAADDPNVKVSMLRRKSAEEALKAQVMAAKATTKEELNAAKALQASSRAYNDQAFSISRSIKKKYENGKATRDLTDRELALQKRQSGQLTQDLFLRQDRWQVALAKGEKGVEANTKSLAESSREIVAYQAEMDGLSKKLLELNKAAADSDLTPVDRKKAKEAAAQAAENFGKRYQEGIDKFALSGDPLVKGLFEEIKKLDTAVELNTIMQVPTNMQEIHDQIQDAFETMFDADPINISVRLFAEGEGREVETQQQLSQETAKFWERNRKSRTEINAATKATDAYTAAQKNALDSIRAVNEISEERTKVVGVGFGGQVATQTVIEPLTKAEQKYNDILGRIEALAVQGPKTGNEVADLAAELNKLPNELLLKIPGQEISNSLQYLRRAATAFQSQAENTESAMSEQYSPHLTQQLAAQTENTRKRTEAQAALNAKLEERNRIPEPPAEQVPLEKTNQEATELQTTQSNVTAEVGNTNMGVNTMTTGFQSAETAAQGVADAVMSISRATATVQGPVIQNPFVEQQAHGGRIGHFANGGQGTDVIPAMLSAGERVTNARSSRRFATQLEAINAGQTPVYRSEGGDTYNTNVGDINVSGASSPDVTARTIMQRIRREERRGSGR
jgi:TP901 family phage tail tape measure protein